MKRYRGYYIDGVVFKSMSEIDTFVKNSIIDKVKQFMGMFISEHYTAEQKKVISDEITIREQRLQTEFGMTATEIEAIEESCY